MQITKNKIITLLVFIIIFLYITEVKIDTILLVLGNFAIAYYIATIISKKAKNDELKIANCFKELEYLSKLTEEIRISIEKKEFTDDCSIRLMSLVTLQIDLIKKKYSTINEGHIKKLEQYNKELDRCLTNDSKINEDYKKQLLFIEQKILVIKSEILD